MAKFLMEETIHSFPVWTARLGTTGARFTDKEPGKPVKLIAESNYELCADGDAIEGFCNSVNLTVVDGFTLGGYSDDGRKYVTFSGTALAVGDYVVAAAQPAKGTALTKYAVVKKAADQAAAATAPYKWRVVSLGSAGTGAAGTHGLIQRV